MASLALGATVTLSTFAAEGASSRTFADAALGVGVTSGTHSFSTTTNLGHTSYWSEGVTGPVVSTTLMAGEAWSRFAVGVGIDAALTVESAVLLSGSAVAILHSGKSGVYGALFAGYGWADLAGPSIGMGVPPEYVVAGTGSESKQGPRFALRAGYRWPSMFGIATTASYSYLIGGDSKYEPIMVVIQATWSWW